MLNIFIILYYILLQPNENMDPGRWPNPKPSRSLQPELLFTMNPLTGQNLVPVLMNVIQCLITPDCVVAPAARLQGAPQCATLN